MLKQATNSDAVLSKLREAILSDDVVENIAASPEIKHFLRYWERLWVQDDVIILDNRTVIPTRLRERILLCLHSAHQGTSQMFSRAEQSVFWPNMHSDIENTRAGRLPCTVCRRNAPSLPKLPPHDQPKVEYPFQQVCSDYLSLEGVRYLVTVDRYSGWPDVRRAAGHLKGAAGLLACLRDLFQTFGIPEEIASDGGTEYMSHEIQSLLKRYGVRLRVSSVGNPHSNQRAEVGVKSIRRLLRGNLGPSGGLNNDNFAMAILEYRNTPMQSTGMSPAETLFGRQLRDFVPLTSQNYVPSPQWLTKMRERELKVKKAHQLRWSEGG